MAKRITMFTGVVCDAKTALLRDDVAGAVNLMRGYRWSPWSSYRDYLGVHIPALLAALDQPTDLPLRTALGHLVATRACTSCGAAVVWQRTERGEPRPYNLDGRSHFATCADAGKWSKKQRKEQV